MHHAFVIEAEAEEGIAAAHTWIKENLDMEAAANPDVVTLRFGLFSADDARRVCESASQAPFAHDSKAILITANRAYHEAQNGLLKLFEEPPPNTYLFFILPSLGGLLPTLRSRVHILKGDERLAMSFIPEGAEEFMKAGKERRSALIKKLASGKDEEERRENRDKAISILNGIEAAAYKYGFTKSIDSDVGRTTSYIQLLCEIQMLRGYLYDRSAPVKMILEHLSLVLPRDLGRR